MRKFRSSNFFVENSRTHFWPIRPSNPIEFFARSHFHKCEEKTYFVAFFDAPFRLQKVRIIYKSLTPIHFAFSLKIFIYLNIIRILFSLEIKKNIYILLHFVIYV